MLTVMHRIKRGLIILLSSLLIIDLVSMPLLVSADEPDYTAEMEERKNEKVDTNDVTGWPDGPAIGAKGAILMDADTGEILYAKNIDEKLFPASTTKLMTCLLGIERANLNDLVTVSQEAINANESDGSSMGLTAGEQLTVEELMYGILITSANEACNALGEHVAGSIDGYVEMMNQRAAELGCSNTHFVTTNGLQDENHYTTARDLALIAKEFFKYDFLCRLSSTAYYSMEESSLHEAHELYSKNKLYKNRDYAYEYLVGSKTGYTSVARQTLVSCAEKDGVRLICVILKEESPYQFQDTVDLFNYGFSNFKKVSINANETRYNINNEVFFDTESNLFGSSSPMISIAQNSYLLLPNNAEFSDLTSEIVYENVEAPFFGMINYYYNGYVVGNAGIAFAGEDSSVKFETLEEARAAADAAAKEQGKGQKKNVVLINIFTVIKKILIAIVVFFVIIVGLHFGKRFYNIIKEKNRRNRKSKQFSSRRDYEKRQRGRPIKKPGKSSFRPGSSTAPKKRNDVNFDDIKF